MRALLLRLLLFEQTAAGAVQLVHSLGHTTSPSGFHVATPYCGVARHARVSCVATNVINELDAVRSRHLLSGGVEAAERVRELMEAEGFVLAAAGAGVAGAAAGAGAAVVGAGVSASA